MAGGSGDTILSPNFNSSVWSSNYLKIHPWEDYNVFSIKPQVRGYEELCRMLDKERVRPPILQEVEKKKIQVDIVMLAQINGFPVLLAIRSPANEFKVSLPGLILSPGETVKHGLRRCLANLLLHGKEEDMNIHDFQVVRCIGRWWQSRDGTYVPYENQYSKICRKLYLVQLPPSVDFELMEHVSLVPYSLPELHENRKQKYDAILAGLPLLLTKMLWFKEESLSINPITPTNGVKWIASLPEAVDTSNVIEVYPYLVDVLFVSESHTPKLLVQKTHIDEYGMEIIVEGLLVVQRNDRLNVLAFEHDNTATLPGGLVAEGESEMQALKRCLSTLLRANKKNDDWNVRGLLGAWWGYSSTGSFTYPYPILGSRVCRKVFLVQLAPENRLVLPYGAGLFPQSFQKIHADKYQETFDEVLRGLPLLLSRFTFIYGGGDGLVGVAATGGGGGADAAEEKVEENDMSDYDMSFRLSD